MAEIPAISYLNCMSEMNQDRALVTHLREICARRGISLTAFSGDWLFCLQKEGRLTYIFGYDFGINNAAAKMICKDKTATSDLLGFHQIPCIEHRIFHGPQLAAYVPMGGSWREMLAFLESCPMGVVCKPNEGTGGNSVFRATTAAQLEAAVYQIFARNRSLCLSPFEDFEHEYRVALLDGEIQFIYRKVRPSLRGDGKHSVRELFLVSLHRTPDLSDQIAKMKSLPEMEVDWDRVPPAGEAVTMNWRHNLGLGASPELLTPEDPMWEATSSLALRAAKALDVRLASVDLASTRSGLKVLEINSGIMMESLVRIHPEGEAMATRFYDRIICLALGLPVES
jgi:glutathione synthase/RimK-type ligase-like ATP-grasp enzyme